MHLADGTNNGVDSNKKHSSNLKNWCFKMPNAPYLNRCVPFGENKTLF